MIDYAPCHSVLLKRWKDVLMHQAPPDGLSSVDAQTVITITRMMMIVIMMMIMIMIMRIPNKNQISLLESKGKERALRLTSLG